MRLGRSGQVLRVHAGQAGPIAWRVRAAGWWRGLGAAAALAAVGCTPPPSAPPSEPPVAPTPGRSTTATPPPTPAAVEIDEASPLHDGRVAFVGMVRPVKGGHEVRGVILADESLPDALAKSAIDGLPSDPDWFLGAKVRVTATLVQREAPAPRTDGLAEQRREGTWLVAEAVESVALVARAEVLEGTLSASKGLLQIAGQMVSRQDLAWAIPGGAEAGDRVRLWGQPRTHVCRPNAQCLTTGSIPMFDLGRAVVLQAAAASLGGGGAKAAPPCHASCCPPSSRGPAPDGTYECCLCD